MAGAASAKPKVATLVPRSRRAVALGRDGFSEVLNIAVPLKALMRASFSEIRHA
jgi:hypothetical protein